MIKDKNIICGNIVSLDFDNIDTDMIIPSDYIKNTTSQNLGDYLFHNNRKVNFENKTKKIVFEYSDSERPSFLLSRKNFGCGSSREHAVWALKDFGIKAILAVSYSDIFFQNCINNFILPLCISIEDYNKLKEHILNSKVVQLDLKNKNINGNTFSCSFSIPENDLKRVIEREDLILKILEEKQEIINFDNKYKMKYEWIEVL